MERYRIEVGGRQFELPPGELLVGRDDVCHIRFSDASVSRRHLRILWVGKCVVACDLESHNGTYVNGRRHWGPVELADGDQVRVGDETFRFHRVKAEQEEGLALPKTQPRIASSSVESYSAPRYHTCRQCRCLVAEEDGHCPACDTDMRAPRVEAESEAVPSPQGERRASSRRIADVSGLYVSVNLTFNAPVANISRAGLFLMTELFDPVGTEADIVLMTVEYGGARFGGRVVRVEPEQDMTRGIYQGVGIELTAVAEDARQWLDSFVHHHGS